MKKTAVKDVKPRGVVWLYGHNGMVFTDPIRCDALFGTTRHFDEILLLPHLDEGSFGIESAA